METAEDYDPGYVERCLKVFDNLGLLDSKGKPVLENMMIHMLECAMAMKVFREMEDEDEEHEEQQQQQQPSEGNADDEAEEEERTARKEYKLAVRASKNNIFHSALMSILQHPPEDSRGMFEEICQAFPDESKMKDGRGWLPLHWASLLLQRDPVDDDTDDYREEFQQVYSDAVIILKADPTILRQHHLSVSTGIEGAQDGIGLTPVHLLAMHPSPSLSLARAFGEEDPGAFSILSNAIVNTSTSTGNRHNPHAASESGREAAQDDQFTMIHPRSIFHLLSEYSSSEELLRYVIDLNLEYAREVCTRNNPRSLALFSRTPIDVLCTRDEFDEKDPSLERDEDEDGEEQDAGDGTGQGVAGHDREKLEDNWGLLTVSGMLAALLEVTNDVQSLKGTIADLLLTTNDEALYRVIDAYFKRLLERQRETPFGELSTRLKKVRDEGETKHDDGAEVDEENEDGEGITALNCVEALLAFNPKVARFRTASSNLLLHVALSFGGHFGACMVSMLHDLNPDAVRTPLISGDHPLLVATYYSSVDVISFLFDLVPEAAMEKAPSENAENFLHITVDIAYDHEYPHRTNPDAVAEKVRFLCERCPQMVKERDRRGFNPLHLALMNARGAETGVNVEVVRTLCEVDPTILGDRIQVDEEEAVSREYLREFGGKLPLHVLLTSNTFESPVCGNADCLRFLLRQFPMAVLLADSTGMTPIDIAEKNEMDDYYKRLLYRTSMFLSPALRELNYSARREALLLAYPRPTPEADTEEERDNLTLLSKLRRADMNLLRIVISYL